MTGCRGAEEDLGRQLQPEHNELHFRFGVQGHLASGDRPARQPAWCTSPPLPLVLVRTPPGRLLSGLQGWQGTACHMKQAAGCLWLARAGYKW